MEELEQSDANVSQESSSPAPASETSQEQSQEAATTQTKQEDSTPFHEHPRFKELVEDRNRAKQELADYQRRMAEMERQLQTVASPKKIDPAQAERTELLARLKGIDPAFGKLIEDLNGKAEKLSEFDQWKSQQESERVRSQAITMIQQFHAENKAPKELHDLIQTQIEAAAMRDPSIGLHNLKQVYQEKFNALNGVIETIKRAERESYVKTKTEDSSTPATAKGTPTKPGQKSVEWSKDPQERRAQLERRILDDLRQQRRSASP